ncbi:MAG: hypothetical protein RBS07_07220 [Lentimicrobium sp.]|nr:hypothetical protein [Lentimicrobium sp.]
MCFRNVVILVLIFSLVNDAFAQETPISKDSTHLYENIENYSEQSKFTKYLYRLFFKPVAPVLAKIKKSKRRIQKPYSTFEGKTIRNINIVTLDPFGNSIGDTIVSSLNFLTRAGNKFHLQSRASAIRNLLLIKKNQPFDALLVTESERLVRSMNYITDVSFYVEAVRKSPDSVDVFIRELDKWSLIPGGSISASRLTFDLRENNFLGLGHEFQNNFVWNHSNSDFANRTRYFIPNYRNTYINSTLEYGTDENGNFIKSIAFDRPFFSPFAKWAAGINISQQLNIGPFGQVNFMRFKYNRQDYWAGNAVRIFKGITDYERTTNFISSARFIRTRFLEKPSETVDTLHFYTDENFYIVSIGVSSRLYVKDKYIFKFGIAEDVPVGKVISLTGGYQVKNNIERVYLGTRFSAGNYYSWGYLSSNFEYGTFLRSSKAEQGVFSAGINYFTNLIEIGPWKLRQFIKPQFIAGINRIDYDSLTINNEYGLRGFNSPLLSGNSRILLTSQTQLYAPWDFVGFHFGPYFTFSLGMLGDVEKGFRDSDLYAHIGLGVLIKNENLVMSTFQLTLSFYPEIPGKGFNVFKFNSFQTSDFGFRDFEIGKPATVVFR